MKRGLTVRGDRPRNWRMNFITLGGIVGALGVALGAFGAHGLSRIATQQQLGWWETGVRYQLVTAVALVLFGLLRRQVPGNDFAGWALFVGAAIFSGSLYLMTLGAPRWLGAITPIGGLSMIAGWILLAVAARH